MAETLAVVGLVASIVQLVHFSSKVLDRLDDFQSSLGEIPKSFRHIKAELPVLRDVLRQTKDAIDAGSVQDETKRALIPAIEGCAEQIGSLDTILTKTLPTPNDSKLRRGTKAIGSLHQDAKVESITKILRGYTGTLTFYYAAASSTLQPRTDAMLVKIRQWLSPPDPSLNHQKALKLHQAETGLWFLKSDEYINWKTNCASFLWLYGIPGCGKTILSSTILENVYQCCANDPGKVVAYFYFDFSDARKQLPELMIRSLISQLSQQCVRIPASLKTLHSSCENGQRQPSLDTLLGVLHDMIHQFPQAYIVLDALDECIDQVELMEILETMSGWRLEELHLLVTSRKERDIESILEYLVEDSNIICLQSKLVDQDIRRYVHQRLSVDKVLKKWQKDPEVVHKIETVLMEGAQGMFRWAVCQLDLLAKCVNRAMVWKTLAHLPPTLDATYERILCSIEPDYSEYASRILQWLAYSARPLLVEEVAEALAIDFDRDPAFDCNEVLEDPLDVLRICSSLVNIATPEESESVAFRSKPKDKILLLAHYSVKEYLISDRSRKGPAAQYSIQPATGNEFIAKSCLSYLLQFQESDSLTRKSVQEFKLARYSAEFWITHTRGVSQKSEVLNSLIMELFSTGNGAYLNWTRIYNPDRYWEEPVYNRQLEDVPSPLYYASAIGLAAIVELLLDKDADVNAQGGKYGNALQAASRGGYSAIVELLLSKGAIKEGTSL